MLEGKKILIVDDKPEVVQVLSQHFTAANAVPLGAHTYVEALAIAEKDAPDIALVDLDLMGQSGIDLIKAIKKLPPPHPYFAILTNSTNVMDVANAVDLDVTTFIQKADHNPSEIVQMVAQQYAKKHGGGTL